MGTSEAWDAFVGEEYKMYGDYIITISGKVYSTIFRNNQVTKKRDPPKMMKPRSHNGYLIFNASSMGKRKTVMIHQLVTKLFHGPRPHGRVVGHRDGIKTNNHASNLYWITQEENGQDSVRHGTSNAGERNGCSKLQMSHIHLIRDLEGSMSQSELATIFEVCQTHISRILNKTNWGHLPDSQKESE